jgi:hypothetical protein
MFIAEFKKALNFSWTNEKSHRPTTGLVEKHLIYNTENFNCYDTCVQSHKLQLVEDKIVPL